MTWSLRAYSVNHIITPIPRSRTSSRPRCRVAKHQRSQDGTERSKTDAVAPAGRSGDLALPATVRRPFHQGGAHRPLRRGERADQRPIGGVAVPDLDLPAGLDQSPGMIDGFPVAPAIYADCLLKEVGGIGKIDSVERHSTASAHGWEDEASRRRCLAGRRRPAMALDNTSPSCRNRNYVVSMLIGLRPGDGTPQPDPRPGFRRSAP